MTTQNSWDNQVLDANVSFIGGTFSVGTDATSGAINIATGAADRVTTIGNITGASSLDLKFGTGDFTLANSTGTIINSHGTGEINYPLQPSFMAYVNTTVLNITGNGAEYKICDDNNTTVFDQSSDYDDDGVFTAPVNGRYQFNSTMTISDTDVSMTIGLFKIVTSNRTYEISKGFFNTDYPPITQSSVIMTDMDAADTSYATITLSNGGGDTADIIGGASAYSIFSGFLMI